MEKWGNKANWALTGATLGYLASYPFSATFTGGLVASACGAAMVGGIADWFAVTALFRRPLGIPYRTNIIARNREKLLQVLSDMVEQELLTFANIKKKLEDYNGADLLVEYLRVHGGAQEVKTFLTETGLQFVRLADGQQLGRTMELILRKEMERYELAPVLANALEWSVQSGYGDTIIDFVLDELVRLASTEQLIELLGQVAAQVQTTYERGMNRRRIFNHLVGQVVDLTPQRAGQLVQQQLIALLEELKEPNHFLRLQLSQWLLQLVAHLRTDQELRKRVEMWKNNWLTQDNLVRNQVTAFFLRLTDQANGESLEQRLRATVNSQVDQWLEDFAHNQAVQQQVNDWMKQAIVSWLDTRHSELGRLVRQKLNGLSAEELSRFVESKVGDDLQMIRINGSLVGGLLGSILYMSTYWLQ